MAVVTITTPSLAGGGSSGSVLTVTKTVSSAEILAMPESPVEVIPSPGDGFAIEIVKASVYYVFGTTPYVSHMSGSGIQLMLYCPQDDSDYPPNFAYGRWWEGVSGDAFINYSFPATRLVFSQGTQEGVISTRFDGKPIYFNTYGYGQIATLSVGSGGLGYVANDTFSLDGFGGSVGVVDTVDEDGAVLTCHLTTNVSNCSAQNNIATTAITGIGTGLTINALTIQSLSGGDGTFELTVLYNVIPV